MRRILRLLMCFILSIAVRCCLDNKSWVHKNTDSLGRVGKHVAFGKVANNNENSLFTTYV